MKTVLITAIAGDVAQGVARVVRELRPSWRTVGVDVHRQHGGSLCVDRLDEVPWASDPGFLPHLRQIVQRDAIDYILPMSEAELRFLHGQGLSEIGGAPLIGFSAAALDIGLDKLATARFLASIGIPGPWTVEADTLSSPPQLPCIFKPKASAGSKGVAICHTAAEATWQAAQTPGGIFQQLLLPADREVTCAVYRDRNGHTRTLPMLRRLVDSATGWARVIDAPEAVDQCRRIAEALDLHGPINVQMRLTAEGPRIFEINPRFSSTVWMRHLLGFRDVGWMLDELDGQPAPLPQVKIGAEVVRVQGGAVL